LSYRTAAAPLCGERRIAGDDRDALAERLGREQSIKRIAMGPTRELREGQHLEPLHVGPLDVEHAESSARACSGQSASIANLPIERSTAISTSVPAPINGASACSIACRARQ
jgi:hypothetical protein